MRTPASKTQHTPFTFFRATAGLIELKHSISYEVIRRRSLFQPFEILASRHQDSLNDVKHSDGRCLLVLGKTNHWPQLPLHGAILNRNRGSDNKLDYFSDKSLSEISSCLLDGCHVVVLVPAKRTSQDCRSLSVCLALCPVLTRRCSTAAESRLSGLVEDFLEVIRDCSVSRGLPTSTLSPQVLHSKSHQYLCGTWWKKEKKYKGIFFSYSMQNYKQKKDQTVWNIWGFGIRQTCREAAMSWTTYQDAFMMFVRTEVDLCVKFYSLCWLQVTLFSLPKKSSVYEWVCDVINRCKCSELEWCMRVLKLLKLRFHVPKSLGFWFNSRNKVCG